MQAVVKDGFQNAERIIPIVLAAFEQALGKNGLRTLLNAVDRSRQVYSLYADLQRMALPFTYFSAIFLALEEIYGAKGGRVLAVQTGRSVFSSMLDNFPELAGIKRLRQQSLSEQVKIRTALITIASFLSQVSHQECSVADDQGDFSFTLDRCPACWGRSGHNQPVCSFFNGFLGEAIKQVAGGEGLQLREVKCLTCGDPVCEFLIQKPASRPASPIAPDSGISD